MEIFDPPPPLRRHSSQIEKVEDSDLAQFFEDGIKMKINSEIKPPFLKHQLDFELDGRQLGRDFKRLRKLLDQFLLYKNSSLVGPDVNQLRAQWGKVFEKSQIIMDKLSLNRLFS